METRIALVGIIVEELAATERLNAVLHDFGEHVVGRMGVPYRERGLHIISVILDAPAAVISSLTGKLGMIPGVSVKTLYSKAGAVHAEP